MKLTTQWSQHISRKFSTQCLLYIICLGQLEFDNPPRWTQFDCTLTIIIINTSSGCWACFCCLFKLAFPLELTNVINNFGFRERMQLKSNTILKQIFTATDYRENRGKMETRNQRDCPLKSIHSFELFDLRIIGRWEVLSLQSAVAGEKGLREERRKVQQLGNCSFEATPHHCTELNQRIEQGDVLKKRSIFCMTCGPVYLKSGRWSMWCRSLLQSWPYLEVGGTCGNRSW